jgi:spore germination cell wall hydrolase CwlJ-like protein/outer membrane murein-binding lipoprotein Lpp
MRQYMISVSAIILAAILLSGCVANEAPKSNLLASEQSTDSNIARDEASFAADLPDQGPAPKDRPNILALASGEAMDSAELEVDQTKPADQMAMVEPEKKRPVLERTRSLTEKAQPVIASNRERDCLMRAMYFESNRSSPDGLLSVGTVVMHRLENGAWGKSICGVVGAPRQFAPGALSRKMQGDLTDLQLLADQIIAGKRQPKLAKNVMFFHVAGMRFPYKNMRYVHVAGGNTFYYKAQRKRRA